MNKNIIQNLFIFLAIYICFFIGIKVGSFIKNKRINEDVQKEKEIVLINDKIENEKYYKKFIKVAAENCNTTENEIEKKIKEEKKNGIDTTVFECVTSRINDGIDILTKCGYTDDKIATLNGDLTLFFKNVKFCKNKE